MSTQWVALEIKVYVHVLAEAAGIVIPNGLGIAERFQYDVGLEQNVLDPFNFRLTMHIGYGRQILHDDLRCFRLARSRFARDEDARVAHLLLHGLVRRIGNGEDVRYSLEDFAALVLLHLVGSIDGQCFVRIHCYAHFANVRVVQARLISGWNRMDLLWPLDFEPLNPHLT